MFSVEACLLFVAEVRDAEYIWEKSTEEDDEVEEYSNAAMSSLLQISGKIDEKKLSRCVLSVCSHYLQNGSSDSRKNVCVIKFLITFLQKIGGLFMLPLV